MDITTLSTVIELRILLALHKYCYIDVKVQRKIFFFTKIIKILGNTTFESVPLTYM